MRDLEGFKKISSVQDLSGMHGKRFIVDNIEVAVKELKW